MKSEKRKDISAIVLAGGESSRMKHNKALLPICGQTLIEKIINQIKDLFNEILISTSEEETYKFLGYKIVIDEKLKQGPLMGLLSSLKQSKNSINFIISCDIPDIDISFLIKMLSCTKKFDIIIPRYNNGKYEPLLAIYNKNIIPEIEKLLISGNRKIDPLFSICNTGFIEMDNERWYKNLNTFEDYSNYIEALKQ